MSARRWWTFCKDKCIYVQYACVYVCVPAAWGQGRGQDERKWPMMDCASHQHPCPQLQLHPMHSLTKKRLWGGGITHNAQRKALFLSHQLIAKTRRKKADKPTSAHAHTKTCQIWDSPLGTTPMTHTGKGFPWGSISVHWENCETQGCLIIQSSVGLVKFKPLAQPHVMRGVGGGVGTPQTVLWSGVQVSYGDSTRGHQVQTLASKSQDSPKIPLHWPAHRNHLPPQTALEKIRKMKRELSK